MEKGIELLLSPRVRIPNWIRNQTLNVSVQTIMVNDHRVRSVRIKGADASFAPGIGVIVKMPCSDEWWVAFGDQKVLEIRDLEGHIIKRNYNLCTECMSLSGRMVHYTESNAYGRIDATYMCTHCLHTWRLERI